MLGESVGKNHTYTAIGNYTIIVTAFNIMSRVTMTYDVYVQRPVLPAMFAFDVNTPVVFPGMCVTFY